MTKGRKINDLARVTYIGQGDGITGTGIVEMALLGTGETVTWRPDGFDWETTITRVAPVQVGDEIALEGFAYSSNLRRVRYTCHGRTFRGMAFHNAHRETIHRAFCG